MTVHVEIADHFQLRASTDEPADSYAFHLVKGSDTVAKSRYQDDPSHTFGITAAGVYRVKVYRRLSDRRVETALSAPLRFAGFLDAPAVPRPRPIAIAGVSRQSAFAALVFSRGHEVRCVVDPTQSYVGETFCGLPVVDAPPDGTRLIGPEGYLPALPDMEPFSLRSGAVDALSQEFHRYGAMDLYRIGREAHMNGMPRGAHAIEMFTLAKYSTRLPATAVIGEGTALGVGGMAIAIHPDSRIGQDCVIAQNVTLGSRQGGGGTPVIGDNVYIGPGSVCLGGRIGSNVVVGAGAVVLDEVPDDCVVAGVPAKIVSRDMERYRALTHRRVAKGTGR